ncbi:MAG: Crp/Fnr family transcriptional regulator [Bacteroidales bacterium]|nr:Crp/Fnr family transcriptional regulator [Bacteroidales bacterium]MDP3002915.1 Crp/Fnr family transcriptional regulator [Bacteroidales bacterium]
MMERLCLWITIYYFYEKTMDYSLLSKTPLFRGLTTGEIDTILSVVPYRTKKFQAGSLISQSGEPVNSLIVVISGVVKGEMVDYAGRVIKIEDIPAPGALASAFMFGNRNRFPVNVIAVSDGELLLIEKPDFLKLLMRNDIILVNFLDMISNRSQFLSEKIKFLNFKTIKGKLAHYILQKAGKEKASILLDMTQNELADFFGVARPSVARALGELEEEGYLEAKGKNIKIIDKEGLADLAID